MAGRTRDPRAGRGWGRVGLATGCVALVAGGFGWVRSAWLAPAAAQPADPKPAAAAAPEPAPPPAGSSDYASRVVAYLYDNEPVSRQDLGEYLIARRGPEKLELLVNRRIIEYACREQALTVNEAEVEAALAEDLKGLNMNRSTFVSTVLARYQKSLYEWKEDVIRPKLLLTKLCRSRVQVSEADVQRAYEAAHGEKLEGRLILWPPGQERQARAEYAAVRDSDEAFEERAKHQHSPTLASSGGKVKPFGRHTMADDAFDREVFTLRPGEISTLIETPQGFVVFKCDRRLPADTTVNQEAARPRLTREVLEQKVAQEMQGVFKKLRAEASPVLRLEKNPDGGARTVGPEQTGVARAAQVVATFNGDVQVTREELGEYLITRYGPEQLELLVNHRVIDKTCRARGIAVTEAEVEEALDKDVKALGVDREHFAKDLLSKYRKNLYEWKEDVIRPRLLLTRLCRDRVRATDEDIRQAFEAYHGEKIEGRMILWPPDQAKFALAEYARIRDSEEEFAKKAKSQASSTLAATGGKVPAFGRHTLGDENLEREAFKLQPGEVTTLVGTPQGDVVLKCDKRLPADPSVKLEDERDKLAREVIEKKVQLEMQVAFKELRAQANPRLMLKDPNKPADLTEETKRVLADTAEPGRKDAVPLPRRGDPPAP
jgi:parvulin-like peptidyl-prolyl isomerase